MIHAFSMFFLRMRFGRRAVTAGFAILFLTVAVVAPCARGQENAVSNSLDVRDAHGLTALIAAASANQGDSVKSLLAQGASVNATSADGRTALMPRFKGIIWRLFRYLLQQEPI